MRGSLYAISEIALFIVGAGLLGLLLGLLIRRPRPQSVRAAAEAGPDRAEIERRLAAAVGRSESLESKLNAALARVDTLSQQNTKLEELRAADATYTPSDEVANLQAKAEVVDRLEGELAERDAAIVEKEHELSVAAKRIAALESAAAAAADRDGEGGIDGEGAVTPVVPEEEYLPPRQNPTGPGAFTDMIEFEVGGAD